MGFGNEYFKHQRYDQLKKDLLKKGELFTDPEFPPNQKSLFHTKSDNEIVWKRPSDLCKVPKLVIDGGSCEDLIEGELGNRWFISACSSLAYHPQLFNKVVPDLSTQEYNMATYCGIFKFNFWLYGKWTEVVVDDYLPTKHGRLIFCHSSTKNEFWSALLEKAYAKLFGDYESLKEGYCVDALVDFTGGVAERRTIQESQGADYTECLTLYTQLRQVLEDHAIVVAEIREDVGGIDLVNASESTQQATGQPEADVLVLDTGGNGDGADIPDTPQRIQKTGYFRSNSISRDGFVTDFGLLKCHGYIITKVNQLELSPNNSTFLIRLRSPFQCGEWMGPWANNSQEMSRLKVQEKNKLGLGYSAEAEFWMPISEFIKYFTNIEICHFINTSFFSLKKTWTETQLLGQWEAAGTSINHRAGGNYKHPSFLQNPQYVFDVTAAGQVDVIISLEQNDRTALRRGTNVVTNHCIGFSLIKVEENRKYRLHKPVRVVAHSYFSTDRSIFYKTPLSKGRYVLVACTAEPREQGEFLLRVYNSSNCQAKELTVDAPKRASCCCVLPISKVVQLTIIKAEGLTAPKGDLNAMVSIQCEGEMQKTSVWKESGDPSWDVDYIFYKKHYDEKHDIHFQIFNSHTIHKKLLCEAKLHDLSDETGKELKLPLYQKSKKKYEPDIILPGCLKIFVKSSEDLAAF